jgi:hypothetical protein
MLISKKIWILRRLARLASLAYSSKHLEMSLVKALLIDVSSLFKLKQKLSSKKRNKVRIPNIN